MLASLATVALGVLIMQVMIRVLAAPGPASPAGSRPEAAQAPVRG
jgi:hypothetical protein